MRVNEIFCSLQGEGHFTGTPAVFLRLAGCNLRCPFCDTVHEPFRTMSVAEICATLAAFAPRHIVITGGEPCLQLTAELTQALHAEGFFIQVETNGTLPLPQGADVDWVTCSPKQEHVALQHVDELKVLCHGGSPEAIAQHLLPYEAISASERRLQPLDTGNAAQNRLITQQTIDFLLAHPRWKLSLQTHKILNVR